jgi:transposase InsO family protein
VKQRLAVVSYAEEYGVKPASRRFGLNRKTIRVWRERWRRDGDAGLLPRYPPRRRRRRLDDRVVGLIRQARVEHRYGAGRTKIWLERVHQVQVTARTIQRVFRDLGLPYLTKWFQYTGIDDCTRIRVLRLYRRLNQQSSLLFLRELQEEMPFPIRKIQVDNGTEFSLAFALTCRDLGIRVRYIKPRRPQQNGKVERSHRIDEEEFWSQYSGQDFTDATRELANWAHRYNHERFSMALAGRTPMEKLTAMLAHRAPPTVISVATSVQ